MKSIAFLMLCGAWLYLTNQIASEETSGLNRDFEVKLAKQREEMVKLMEQMTEMQKEVKTLTEKQKDAESACSLQVTKLREETHEKIKVITKKTVGGATYIRWGRRSCEGTTSEIVYLGVAGGTPHYYTAAGANLLCLPRDPSFGNFDSTDRGGFGLVGVEYYLGSGGNFPFETTSPLLQYQDVPCAMCKATNASNVVMIPGRRECYSGWNVEYRGYLMAGGGLGRNEYICVDDYAEADIDGSGDEPSVALYPVEADCGSLPCPPYTQYYELACVVCSQ